MNSGGGGGGGGGGATAASSAVAGGYAGPVKRFPHWIRCVIISLLTGGLWIPGYFLMYLFRNRRYYY